MISLWCLLFFWDELKVILLNLEVPLIATTIVKDAFPEDQPVTMADDGFNFAVALSSKKHFSKKSAEDFSKYAKFTLDQFVCNSEDKCERSEIPMKPCSDMTKFNMGSDLSKNERDTIDAHIDAKQFWCIDDTDISIYG